MSKGAVNQATRVSTLFAAFVCALSSPLLLATSTPLHAQQALLDSRAEVITADIKKTGGTKVLVCDFSGPTGLTVLGIELADEFSESIARKGEETIEPVDRSKIPELLHQGGQ